MKREFSAWSRSPPSHVYRGWLLALSLSVIAVSVWRVRRNHTHTPARGVKR